MTNNYILRQYHATLWKYRVFTHRLNKRLKNKTLSELSTRKRNRLLQTIARLRRKLATLQVQLKYMTAGALAATALAFATPALAQNPVPSGTEFRVNTYTTNQQQQPSIAMDTDGDFVVAWQSTDQDGSSTGIYAQRYNAAGVAQGSEFRVNTYTTNGQSAPAIAMDADGDFVVVWQSTDQDGSSTGIYAQRYNAAGIAQGSEFRVNTYVTAGQSGPSIAMDADGDFAVTWMSNAQDGSGYGIYAQRYNAAGATQGSEFKVNTNTTGQQLYPSIAMDSDGDFVVTWHSGANQDGNSYGVYAQRYNAAGVTQGSEFRVNTYTTDSQQTSSIAMDADGDFVVAWHSVGQDGSGGGVYAQRYNATGVAQGSEFRVNTYTLSGQSTPSAAMDADGDFIVTWQSYNQDGVNYGIYAQRYTALGEAQGEEFRVNTEVDGDQVIPTIAIDADGDFAVTWSANSGDISAQRYMKPNLAPELQLNLGLTIEEGTSGTIINTRLNTTDAEQATEEIVYEITELPANGELKNNGVALVLNDEFTQENLDNTLITYTHDGSETINDTFKFTVSDGTNTLTEETFDLTITAVNDAPVLQTNEGLTVDEGEEGIISSDVLTANDVDNSAAEIVFEITALPTNGELQNNGTTLALNDEFTQDDIDNNLVTYIHDDSETSSDSFAFIVSDGTEELPEATFSITINPIDDTPLSSEGSLVKEDINLYPNPVVDFIKINGLTGKVSDVRILDSNGKSMKMLFQLEGPGIMIVNVSEVSGGIHILQLAEGKKLRRVKFVKK